MRKLSLCVLALFLAGCATRGADSLSLGAPGSAGHPADPARQAADLADCQRYASQIGVASETVDGLVAGAVLAATVVWALGGSRNAVQDSALIGGALGATQGVQALERRQGIVANCMAGRGYAGSTYPAVAAVPEPNQPARSAHADYTPLPARAIGTDTFNAERLARDQSCTATPMAWLAAKGPGFETYTVPCSNGDALAIRCEFGQCRVLR
ncbi:glycine zipper family protein [Acidovorax sp. SUPP950]|uniref:glycine zipper family protein n=1 Tax=unclassified Acidovorax TaxID=2684926 RepID=UPI002348F17E|nr:MULTISPECIES: glycine zipper family protein [unclassified Acidovorax]WCM95855.1 glycine zipper family protein [Acidovorax sp. GBBC 1281]GKS73905.1 glycine zipper family protein [Acidovorax sp. SUPP950]GKT14573.1 glycine zipper family protein [Acidovorax sp. SUPP2522]